MAKNTAVIVGVAAVGIAAVVGVGYLVLSGKIFGGPTIALSATRVERDSKSGLLGTTQTSFSPSTLVITGSGFTKSGNVEVIWVGADANSSAESNGQWLAGDPAADATGNLNIKLNLSVLTPTAGTGAMSVIDTSTGKYSNSINLTTVQYDNGVAVVNATAPSITLSQTNVNYSDILGITSYSPNSIIVSGTGFTTGGAVSIGSSNGNLSITTTASTAGQFTETINFGLAGGLFGGFTPTTGTATITATDSTTQLQTIAYFTVNGSGVAVAGQPTTPVGTTAPGNVVPAAQWTQSGTYGSNLNPIPFGQWAIGSAPRVTAQFYIAGYYVLPNGTELYFATQSDMIAWLTANGYITAVGTSALNPLSIANFVGAGYYGPVYSTVSGGPLATPITAYCSTNAQLQNLINYGTINPTQGQTPTSPWTVGTNGQMTPNGPGYYTFPQVFPDMGVSPANTAIYLTANNYAQVISDYNLATTPSSSPSTPPAIGMYVVEFCGSATPSYSTLPLYQRILVVGNTAYSMGNSSDAWVQTNGTTLMAGAMNGQAAFVSQYGLVLIAGGDTAYTFLTSGSAPVASTPVSTTPPTSTPPATTPPTTTIIPTPANVGSLTNAQVEAAGYTVTSFGPSVNGTIGYIGVDANGKYVYVP